MKKIDRNMGFLSLIMRLYFNTRAQVIAIFLLILALIVISVHSHNSQYTETFRVPENENYWFILHRKSNVEYLYKGKPGNKTESRLIKEFQVKTGVPGEKPTPLPQLMGREYWNLIAEYEVSDDPEIAPYFLTLDIPYTEEYPYGPSPYLECIDQGGVARQCDWATPGSFGLHGINNDPTRLSEADKGSSGCIRHTDQDITYLYNLLDPQIDPIRYYVKDI